MELLLLKCLKMRTDINKVEVKIRTKNFTKEKFTNRLNMALLSDKKEKKEFKIYYQSGDKIIFLQKEVKLWEIELKYKRKKKLLIDIETRN